MSDKEEDRPLSRRERRLKELGATGTRPVASGAMEPGVEPKTDPVEVEEIVISPVDENGRPRTRREMRELREQALAERAAQAEEAAALEEKAALEEAAPVEEVLESDGFAENAEQAEVQVPSFEDHLAKTQPFSRDDFADATLAAADDEAQPDSNLPDEGKSETALEAEIPARSDVDIDSDDDVALDNDDNDDDVVDDFVEAGAVAAEQAVAADTVPLSAVRSRSAGSSGAPQTYTFPDIAPLDDGISVFDDPAARGASGARSEADGTDNAGFDDIISRAVAQEGAASASSTSALILPNMPEGGQLAGRIGETGELYITGSIELPRSLGETGGHAGLLDSVEADPLDELGFAERPASDGGIAPVSAARAVSARATLGPVVTESQKEKSKLPVVLIATGGGLVVAVVALLVWGATSGMFG
ncbi:hypothetical protein ACR5KS_07775 [Leucobacter sp. W1153]|uniref:hypothetical protein n=1 Tax=Leucobacter sp. W1153 TaxID=3439064 RepID=UPI003F2F4C60